MTREIKLYLLVVVLPAVLLTAGGIRLVVLESARARAAVRENLDAKAAEIASSALEALKAAGIERGKFPRRDPHKPPPPRGRFWKDSPRCRRHELPPQTQTILESEIEKACGSDVEAELRHACGCTVIPGGAEIAGGVTGSASLKPVLPDYFIFTAPVGGDAAVAGGIRNQAFLSGILVFLLLASFAGGTALLVRSAKKARDEARRQTDFLSNVSHELKTPLTSITMFAEMLSSDSLDAARREKALKVIGKESRRLGDLIDSLLDFARLERGKAKFAVAKVDLLEISCEAAEASGAAVEVSGSGEAMADAGAVRRVLDCLLENAAKYAAGCKVEITVADGEVALSDAGPGIAPADRKRIFERFWRGDNSVTRTAGGTGLGLAIARSLARGMGGDLKFKPNSPCGATFILELPRG